MPPTFTWADRAGDVIGRIFWCGTALGVAAATIQLIAALGATAAPQQAGAAALAAAFAVIPYVAARTWDELLRPSLSIRYPGRS